MKRRTVGIAAAIIAVVAIGIEPLTGRNWRAPALAIVCSRGTPRTSRRDAPVRPSPNLPAAGDDCMTSTAQSQKLVLYSPAHLRELWNLQGGDLESVLLKSDRLRRFPVVQHEPRERGIARGKG